jgi:hypothetical protein
MMRMSVSIRFFVDWFHFTKRRWKKRRKSSWQWNRFIQLF